MPCQLVVVSSSLVGIDVVRTPDLGKGGAHAGGVASRREEVHPCHTHARSPPDRSQYRRHHRAFRRRSVAVTPSIALALTPSIACRRRAVRRRRAAAAATPPPRRRQAATAIALTRFRHRRQAAADVAQSRCRHRR